MGKIEQWAAIFVGGLFAAAVLVSMGRMWQDASNRADAAEHRILVREDVQEISNEVNETDPSDLHGELIERLSGSGD